MAKLKHDWKKEIKEINIIPNIEMDWKKIDTNNISDGYHTFWELYEHRALLFMALWNAITGNSYDWHECKFIKSKIHEDWFNVWEEWGMFLLCLHLPDWKQISYHLDKKYWDECIYADTEYQAEIPFDWHTSEDVLKRLIKEDIIN